MTTTPGDEDWQRLDPRMLLVHPIREVLRFLPAIGGLFIFGAASDSLDLRWQLLGVLIPVGVGLARYLTTSFRIGSGQVELRRGLLARHLLATRIDRVRTVDLTSPPIHRLLGLTTMRIGTGTASSDEDDSLDLDGLPVERARLLREKLLHDAGGRVDGAATEPTGGRVVLRFDSSWLGYAPFTSSGVVIAAGVLGVAAQVLDTTGWSRQVDLTDLHDGLSGAPAWLLLPAGVALLAVVASALAVGGYLVTNWGFTVAHTDAGGAWHLRRGLFTTRETSLDDDRVAGVSIAEPLGLRLAGGGRLSAIVTGLDRKDQGSSLLVPPAPLSVVDRMAQEVLGGAEPDGFGPLDAALVGHGPNARRRRFSRALLPALAVAGAAVLAVVAGDATPWLWVLTVAAPVVGAALAADRARALGHALVDGHLVARSGSLLRRRDVLGLDHVIGWSLRSTWFQRRAGLTSLVATTAGGRQWVLVLDLPEENAVTLAAQASPGLLEQFLVPVGAGP